ncbi:hypothetical protein [Streptomyces sp. SYSU K217416]
MSDAVSEVQIESIERLSATDAVCIVRCIAGIARPGQRFTVQESPTVEGVSGSLHLSWVDRYGRRVEILDSPHAAKVLLVGAQVEDLKAGQTLAIESR